MKKKAKADSPWVRPARKRKKKLKTKSTEISGRVASVSVQHQKLRLNGAHRCAQCVTWRQYKWFLNQTAWARTRPTLAIQNILRSIEDQKMFYCNGKEYGPSTTVPRGGCAPSKKVNTQKTDANTTMLHCKHYVFIVMNNVGFASNVDPVWDPFICWISESLGTTSDYS